MRIFKVPFDIKREEKIFGGYLSLRQVIYLMLSASSLSIFATPLNISLIKMNKTSNIKIKEYQKYLIKYLETLMENRHKQFYIQDFVK